MPTRAYEGDAGLDLTAVTVRYNGEDDAWVADTHLAFEIPEGHVGLLFPRSSIASKDMVLSNAVGVLDSGYRGSIKFKFKTIRREDLKYQAGDKIGQLVVLPIPQVEVEEVAELSETERGTKGFGSSN